MKQVAKFIKDYVDVKGFKSMPGNDSDQITAKPYFT
jgi:hypothetical protein